jgi:branched-chain amino acid transport system substrate-binding protein
MGYEALQILAQAIGKAGSLDSEKLVEAMEHIRYQGLRGEVTFRTIDHQGNLPSFIGVTAKDGRYPFKVLTDVVRVPAESVWPSREEIDSARSAK